VWLLHYYFCSLLKSDLSFRFCTTNYHRIIEWFGLEGTLKLIWFQPPCREQGHLPLDQVAQSSIQPGPEHCQGGGSHSFSGQSGPGPHRPHSEEIYLNKIWIKWQWKTANKIIVKIQDRPCRVIACKVNNVA